MIDDTHAWIRNRTGKEATDGLAQLLTAANDVGFGWVECRPWRWDLSRSLDDDHWEEIVIWVGETRSGRLGFKLAHRAIHHITDRTQTLDAAMSWSTPRGEQ